MVYPFCLFSRCAAGSNILKQNLMNKINSRHQIIRQPLRNPSPDLKNHNKIVETSSPTPQVKKYLQSIKQINQSQRSIKHQNSNGIAFDQSEQNYNRLNEQILRRRINQLEQENNQFRVCMKQYGNLVSRNRELQDQMLLLLEELQSREDDRLLYEKMAVETRVDTRRRQEVYTKDQYFNTNESSHEESNHGQLQYSQRSGSNQSKQLKIVEPFDFLTIQKEELMEENAYLKAQNLKIKELVDLEVRESIKSLEEKFMNYITSMEQKMNQLNQSHQEIAKLRQSPAFESRIKEDSFSLGQQFEGKSQLKDSKDWNRWDKSSHHSSFLDKNQLLAENPIQINIDLSTPIPDSNPRQSLSKQSSQGSRVHIEMSSLSDSNQSFGKTMHKKLNVSPATPQNNIFNNIKFVQSSSPDDSNYESIVIGRIWEDINNLRENLVFMLGEKSRIVDPSLVELEKKVETQIKSMVEQFFPARDSSNLNQSLRIYFENIQNDTLRFQNRTLQQKVHQLEEQLSHLRRQEIQLPSSRSKPGSEIYLEQSYYKDIPQNCQNEFEQTKRKLLNVIDVIKSFNNDYQFVLSGSKSIQQLQYLPSSN